MSTVTHITDHETRAVETLPHPVQSMSMMVGLVEALVSAVQDAEDAIWGLLDAIDADSATGQLIEIIARLFGVSRNGRTDEYLQALVRQMARARWSHGCIGQLADMCWAITKDVDSVEYHHVDGVPADALFVAHVEGTNPTDAEISGSKEAFVVASPAGTGITVVAQNTDTDLVLDSGHTWDGGYTWSRVAGSTYIEGINDV